MVKPADNRYVVQRWVKTGQRSERQGCRLSDIERLMVRYNARGAMLGTRLQELAQAYSRYGNPTLHDMLRDEGLVTNPKRTYAIYTEE